jgi:hypothetical protein
LTARLTLRAGDRSGCSENHHQQLCYDTYGHHDHKRNADRNGDTPDNLTHIHLIFAAPSFGAAWGLIIRGNPSSHGGHGSDV